MRRSRRPIGLCLGAVLLPVLIWGACLQAQVFTGPCPQPVPCPPVVYTPCLPPQTVPCPPVVGQLCIPCPCPPPIVIYVPGPGGGGKTPEPDSRKVHFVLLGDTVDKEIGKAVRFETRGLLSLYALLDREFRGELELIQGKELRKDVVLQRLQDLPVGKDETLFVYCNLHGESKDGGQNLLLQGSPREKLTRKELFDALVKKNAKLTVLITDACFQDAEESDALASNAAGGPVAKPSRNVPRTIAESETAARVLKQLLVNHEGVVDINACPREQFAFTGVFTPTFVQVTEGLNLDAYDIEEVKWKLYYEQLIRQTRVTFDTAKKNALKFQYQIAVPPELLDQMDQTPVWFPPEGQEAIPYPKYVADGRSSKSGGGGGTARLPAGPAEKAQPALVRIEAPAGAAVFIDDYRLPDNSRRFQTVPLAGEQTQTLRVRAEIQRGDRLVAETRAVSVRGGQEVPVVFELAETKATAAR